MSVLSARPATALANTFPGRWALVPLGLLDRDDDGYRNTAVTDLYLDPAKPTYMGGACHFFLAVLCSPRARLYHRMRGPLTGTRQIVTVACASHGCAEQKGSRTQTAVMPVTNVVFTRRIQGLLLPQVQRAPLLRAKWWQCSRRSLRALSAAASSPIQAINREQLEPGRLKRECMRPRRGMLQFPATPNGLHPR
jgi:hypothetical protein